jgi:hypothetical protein
MNTSEPEMVSVRTLSRLLDISEKTIWDWIYKSRRQATLDPLPYYKLGALVVSIFMMYGRGWIAEE